jgi:hypothetical protein
MPGHIHKAGNVGVLSRSGTLTYESSGSSPSADIGQSTASASAAIRQRHELHRRAERFRPIPTRTRS